MIVIITSELCVLNTLPQILTIVLFGRDDNCSRRHLWVESVGSGQPVLFSHMPLVEDSVRRKRFNVLGNLFASMMLWE